MLVPKTNDQCCQDPWKQREEDRAVSPAGGRSGGPLANVNCFLLCKDQLPTHLWLETGKNFNEERQG